MKNKLADLNNHLFMQLERLTEEDLSHDRLMEEVKRSKSVSMLANQIISNARLALDAHIAINENLIKEPPKMLGAPGYED